MQIAHIHHHGHMKKSCKDSWKYAVGTGDGCQGCGEECCEKRTDGGDFPHEEEIGKVDASHHRQHVLHMLTEGAEAHQREDPAEDGTVQRPACQNYIPGG